MIGPFGRQGPAATLKAELYSNDSKALYIFVMLYCVGRPGGRAIPKV